VTLVEFADLQCPFCAQYARDALPRLIDRYVRPGRIRMQLRLLSFIGPDSECAARVAAASPSKPPSVSGRYETGAEHFGTQSNRGDP
jgi:protein-disulfide isomerase